MTNSRAPTPKIGHVLQTKIMLLTRLTDTGHPFREHHVMGRRRGKMGRLYLGSPSFSGGVSEGFLIGVYMMLNPSSLSSFCVPFSAVVSSAKSHRSGKREAPQRVIILVSIKTTATTSQRSLYASSPISGNSLKKISSTISTIKCLLMNESPNRSPMNSSTSALISSGSSVAKYFPRT